MNHSAEFAGLPPVGASVWAEAVPVRGSDAVMAGIESFSDFFQRLSDELLWPRILVRTTPPPDEDHASA